MFTGIIEEVGIARSVQPGKLVISATEVVKGTRVGDSINVNGACLTVTSLGDDTFSVDVMPETLRRTNLGSLLPGQGVNLERALAAEGRFGGHFVQGHVDATGKIVSMVPERDAVVMKVAAPPEILRYVVEKAYIAVDGISLTVMGSDATSFSVSLVSFTQQHTNLRRKKPGDLVNLEVDIMAKYVERLKLGDRPSLSLEFLREHGFTAG